jgi:hypothetical protein
MKDNPAFAISFCSVCEETAMLLEEFIERIQQKGRDRPRM